MKPYLKLFIWTITISFLGSLPLGTLNLGVAGFAFRGNAAGAFGFAASAITVEMLVVAIALWTVSRLERLSHLFGLFHLVTITILLILSFNSLHAAWHKQPFHAGGLPQLSPVLAGLLLSAINPLHLPFWLGWTAVLRSKKLLDQEPASYTIFITAIGIGTSTAFTLYAFAGARVIPFLGNRQPLLNAIIGISLLITAAAQFRKHLWNKRSQKYHTLSQGQ